jgi:hypothetical protein
MPKAEIFAAMIIGLRREIEHIGIVNSAKVFAPEIENRNVKLVAAMVELESMNLGPMRVDSEERRA